LAPQWPTRTGNNQLLCGAESECVTVCAFANSRKTDQRAKNEREEEVVATLARTQAARTTASWQELIVSSGQA